MKRLFLTVLFGVLLGVVVHVQGSLSSQVLQLLTRDNAFTGLNTFLNLRLIAGVPSDTALRFYADAAGNLYFNGVLVAGVGGVTNPHNLLSSTHPDTLAASVVRGDIIVGNATPAWSRLARCAAGSYVGSNGTDTVCATSAASFTAIPGGQITGALAAVSGAALTTLNASALSSGTVPLAQLSGITTTQLAAGAAILRSQLSIAAGIVLTTDVTGTLPFANGGTNLAAAANNTTLVSGGSAWVATTIPDCHAGTTALGFTQSTNLFNCQALTVGAGSVTSVSLTMPTGFTVGGSPITSTGTLAVTLATEAVNTVWAGPSSGGAATPGFRLLVNADLPTSAVTPGTYPKVTVNQQGIVTGGTTTISLTTDATGTLPYTSGGTGNTTATLNAVLVGNGTGWTQTALPNCTGVALQFATGTSAFSCPGTLDTFGATTVGTSTVGTVAAPFASLRLGTAATNNLTVTPAAFAQATTATVDDPGLAAVKSPLVRRGTIAWTAAAVANGTCSAAQTLTITGLATTSTVMASLNAAPAATWQTGIFLVAYPTANTANIVLCNGSAGSITPASAVINVTAVVP